MTRQTVRIRRVYDAPEPDDGARVLIDRVWPRGLSSDAVRADEWLKDVAPSTSLRRWFGHDPEKFGDFRSRYLDELDDPTRHAALDQLRALVEHGPLTLLTATRDVAHSHAAVLADLLRS
ncbi:DUF488 domain-containing protein [Actinophytocola sp. NPDC049390]|uniref:DUF488 domain-containing protein n=1 Tax=Actinophytocola sp. NPDC049390 TaxID=3363894 RepID=UPI00379FF374